MADEDGGLSHTALQAEIERLRRDLAAAQERVRELETHADIDALLQIFNRRAFERELARALAYVGRYGAAAALVYVDLDGFKPVNDRYGHAIGDLLLRAVSDALTANVRGSDVVGRLGGDEFGVMMWQIAGAQALAKARDLERVIEQAAIEHAGRQLAVGASAGVVALDPRLPVVELIAAADRAMYARKRERRGQLLLPLAGTPEI